MISQEKAEEYMQVATLLAMDICILHEIAQCRDNTADELIDQIALVKEQRDEAINNPVSRRERYEGASMLYQAAASGLVRSDKIVG